MIESIPLQISSALLSTVVCKYEVEASTSYGICNSETAINGDLESDVKYGSNIYSESELFCWLSLSSD
jgi:hypothetical protein